ncbi:MAG TPA: hypothetical protein VGH40_04830 [Roseiarcus sp.]|jgi:hypothetical protein
MVTKAPVYVLQTIFRKQTHDPLIPGAFVWPFRADDDKDAIIRADAMLADWKDPHFVLIWETGNAVRILHGAREVAWRSFERGSAYAEWA